MNGAGTDKLSPRGSSMELEQKWTEMSGTRNHGRNASCSATPAVVWQRGRKREEVEESADVRTELARMKTREKRFHLEKYGTGYQQKPVPLLSNSKSRGARALVFVVSLRCVGWAGEAELLNQMRQ